MRILPSSFAAGLAGVAAALLAGCSTGSSGTLLSTAQARELTAQLTKISANLQGGNCRVAASELAQLRDQVANLDGINATLLSNLNQGVDTTATLASTECPTTTTTKSQTTTTQTTTSSTTSTSTSTSTTSTTTSTTSGPASGGSGISTITSSTPVTPVTPTAPSGGTGLGAGAAGPQGQVRRIVNGFPAGAGFGRHHRHWGIAVGSAGGDH